MCFKKYKGLEHPFFFPPRILSMDWIERKFSGGNRRRSCLAGEFFAPSAFSSCSQGCLESCIQAWWRRVCLSTDLDFWNGDTCFNWIWVSTGKEKSGIPTNQKKKKRHWPYLILNTWFSERFLWVNLLQWIVLEVPNTGNFLWIFTQSPQI